MQLILGWGKGGHDPTTDRGVHGLRDADPGVATKQVTRDKTAQKQFCGQEKGDHDPKSSLDEYTADKQPSAASSSCGSVGDHKAEEQDENMAERAQQLNDRVHGGTADTSDSESHSSTEIGSVGPATPQPEPEVSGLPLTRVPGSSAPASPSICR